MGPGAEAVGRDEGGLTTHRGAEALPAGGIPGDSGLEQPRNFLIIRAGALGDVLLTLPALHLLRARFPDARISAVGYPDIWKVAGDIVDERLSIDNPIFSGLFTGRPAAALIELLRDAEIMAWTSRPPNPALADEGIPILYASPYPPPGIHAAEWLVENVLSRSRTVGDVPPCRPRHGGETSVVCGTTDVASRDYSPIEPWSLQHHPGQPQGIVPTAGTGHLRCMGPLPPRQGRRGRALCRPAMVETRTSAAGNVPDTPAGKDAPEGTEGLQTSTERTSPHTLLRLTNEERHAGRRVLNDLSLHRPIFLHPGAGARWKRWPAQRFAAVAHVLTEQGIEIALIEGPADREDVRAVLDMVGRPLPVLRDLPLRVLAGALSHAKTFLGNDSGVTHLAALAGARTIALFGPTDPASWAPIGDVLVIRACTAQATQQDQIRVCDDPDCMTAIPVVQALSAISQAMTLTQDQ